jgi:hypothetical protein
MFQSFLKCSHPHKLQQLADSLTADDLVSCGQAVERIATKLKQAGLEPWLDKWS